MRGRKHQIRTTWAVAKEIVEAVMTGICGHASEPLSKKARRVYREMLRNDLGPEGLVVTDRPGLIRKAPR